jgi:hypothetical protein
MSFFAHFSRKFCGSIRRFSVNFSKILKLVSPDLAAVSGDGRTSAFFDPLFIIARGGWEVCDCAHGKLVMKKGPRLDQEQAVFPAAG